MNEIQNIVRYENGFLFIVLLRLLTTNRLMIEDNFLDEKSIKYEKDDIFFAEKKPACNEIFPKHTILKLHSYKLDQLNALQMNHKKLESEKRGLVSLNFNFS